MSLKTSLPRWISPAALRSLWRGEFQIYHAMDRDSAEIRAQMLATVLRLTPLMVLSNLLIAGVMLWAFGAALSGSERLAWGGALLLQSASSLAGWWRWRRLRPSRIAPQTLRLAALGAATLALLWATALVAWFPRGHGEHQLMLAMLELGLMCGGAFAMASLPGAALIYTLLMAAGGALALASSAVTIRLELGTLLALYTAALVACVLANARLQAARLAASREALRQGELVGLLLRDFEEHSSDLLWEVGPGGALTHVSPRFAQALGQAASQLHSLSLADALARHGSAHEGAGHHAALRSALVQGKAFRELVVPVLTTAGLRWWSLTARPLLDDGGHHAGWRGVITDVSHARESQRRLAMLAHFDSLTGLANRLQLRERLAQALAAIGADEAAPQWALMCLDVDHFKTINDTLGHAVGDAVLVAVGERLRACVRPGDLVARMGGDEFALLVSTSGIDDVHALARRVVQTLCQPVPVQGRQVPVAVSIGLALAPEHGRALDELMGNADMALYAAKEAGRARYELFAPRLGDRRRRQFAVARALRGAAGRGELELHWQPRVDIDGWRLAGAEVLARWRHPELGVVSPAEFIASAEESGAILEIGAWVIEQACLDAARLEAPLIVSVNASPVQLMKSDFLAITRAALERSGLPPGRLEIEVTESLFLGDSRQVLANLHALRRLGVRVALDDFGTGYSSLAYLRRFPFDTLKIDRAFVRELMTRSDARAIVRSIIELARTLGMSTVAEGVEEPAQLQVLREALCGGVQGYLVARPMPLGEFRELLSNWHHCPAPHTLSGLLPLTHLHTQTTLSMALEATDTLHDLRVA